MPKRPANFKGLLILHRSFKPDGNVFCVAVITDRSPDGQSADLSGLTGSLLMNLTYFRKCLCQSGIGTIVHALRNVNYSEYIIFYYSDKIRIVHLKFSI